MYVLIGEVMEINEIADKNGGLLVFNDSIGRTCYGKFVAETSDTVSIEQPALIMVVPGENGQARVDILRLFFQEFIQNEDGKQDCVVHFNRADITPIEVKITDALREHFFMKILGVSVGQPAQNEPEQIELFDKS